MNEVIFKYRILNNSLSKVNNSDIIRETKHLTSKFLLDNQYIIEEIIPKLKKGLNNEEQSIIIRAIFRFYFKKFIFSKFNLIKNFKKEILIRTLLSEVKFLFY